MFAMYIETVITPIKISSSLKFQFVKLCKKSTPKQITLYQIALGLHKALDSQAGPIAERSNSLVHGRGDPGSNPREDSNVFLRMAN